MVLLDDLQWSDDATLELLAALAAPLRELPMLVLGAYRSDEITRAHQLRRLRNDLRRTRSLRELMLEPLTARAPRSRHILTKLRCRSRTEAAAEAGDLGLLA